MNDFIIEINGTEYNLGDYSSLEEVLEEVNAERLKEYEEYNYTDTPFEEWEVKDMLHSTDWGLSGIHDKYSNANCFEYIEACNFLERSWRNETQDFLDAAIDCDVDIYYPSRISDKYIGQYKSDEDYARGYADDQGVDTSKWPYDCIDWERAAREIMYDVSESNGYYFYD